MAYNRYLLIRKFGYLRYRLNICRFIFSKNRVNLYQKPIWLVLKIFQYQYDKLSAYSVKVLSVQFNFILGSQH